MGSTKTFMTICAVRRVGIRMKNVFIVGSKGIPGSYGGYESFVDNLTRLHGGSSKIKYHVACKSTENGEFSYNHARCFKVKVPNIGPAQGIYYDVMALRNCCKYIENNKVETPIVYILACRIGPFTKFFQKKIHKMGGKLFLNPDGHEWKRAKWSWPVRKYWKISEKGMVKHSDLIICDSKKIEDYILETYKGISLKTTFIPYGAEVKKSKIKQEDEVLQKWYKKNKISSNRYCLIVGRLVPENNYETMVIEYMKSKLEKDLVLITDHNDYLRKLKRRTNYEQDGRIKFVGTVYDQELLKKIRENAYAYIHGHEVGGTNPSLLEALASTKINLLLDVGFNREVAKEGALYWSKEKGDLSKLLDERIHLDDQQRDELGAKAKNRIESSYSWEHIGREYEKVFLFE